jgi:hypothetical protein
MRAAIAREIAAQIRRTRREARCGFRSSGRAPSRSRSRMDGAVITTVSSRPVASTAMCLTSSIPPAGRYGSQSRFGRSLPAFSTLSPGGGTAYVSTMDGVIAVCGA